MIQRLITTFLVILISFAPLCYASTTSTKQDDESYSVIDVLEDPNDSSSMVVVLLNNKLLQTDSAHYPYAVTIRKVFQPDANNTLSKKQAAEFDSFEDNMLTPIIQKQCKSFIHAGRATFIAKHYREIYFYCSDQTNLKQALNKIAKKHDFTFWIVKGPSDESLDALKTFLKKGLDEKGPTP